jgi:hypothetical protein
MGTVSSQQSIDSINDTIVTQPKPSSSASSNGTIASGGSSVPTGTSVSSFERNPIPPTMAPESTEPTYEPYRPPAVLSHERINPFDKNKTPTHDSKTSGIYSSLSSNTTAPLPVKDDSVLKEIKPVVPLETSTKPTVASYVPPTVASYVPPTVTSFVPPTIEPYAPSSGFDYSYKPAPLPTYTSKGSVERQDSKPSEVKAEKSETSSRHKFERKLSDADIIFGSKPEPYTSSFKFENYSRNRSNSSFTSTSTDSEYVYGTRELKKDNPFQKSMSVSSDKDGDFSHDPSVLDSRTYQGINNDAFTDFDSPRTTTPGKKSWSNNDDDDYDLK